MNGIQRLPYADASESLRREIGHLQELAYGPTDSGEETSSQLLHDLALDPQSFVLRQDGRMLSYAGVVTTTIRHDGVEYRASGLSCVATDPDYARQGNASRVVSAATDDIAASGVDLGVFTCAPALVRLYATAGNWEPTPGVVLIGSRDPVALTSTSLGVVVLMRLFSKRAIANAAALREGTIDLNLPVGEFW